VPLAPQVLKQAAACTMQTVTVKLQRCAAVNSEYIKCRVNYIR